MDLEFKREKSHPKWDGFSLSDTGEDNGTKK
jgi:hypothetical protein